MLQIRRAAGKEDAVAVAHVLATVTRERIHSAIDSAWSPDEQLRYMESLSSREAIHVAVDGAMGIVGLQVLDAWSPLASMRHVGTIGTFLLPRARGRGIGRQLWNVTRSFARNAEYRKLVIQVRASNRGAQAFYTQLGFERCGVLTRQVIIDGLEDDEVLMELFL